MRDSAAERELLEREMLAKPVSSLQYMLRQLSRTYQSLPRLVVDGVFGERTLEAVMRFQKEAGLPVTGTVDQATWNAIRDAYVKTEQQYGFPPPLNVLPCGTYTAIEGQECPPVLIVQAMFVSLGKVMTNFSPCKMSSCNDGETPANIRTVQQLAGLPVTGVLDRSTWSYLV